MGFACKTYVNECQDAAGTYGAFLSNRFSQTQDVDQDEFLTIATEGTAHFRTDIVYGMLNPDDLRPFFFLPIPNGFKRENIVVRSMENAAGLYYSFTDRQQLQQLVVGDEVNATRVECTYRQSVAQNDSSVGSVMSAVDRYYNSKQTQIFGSERPEKNKKGKKNKKKQKEEGE